MNFFTRRPPGGPAHRRRIGDAVRMRLDADPRAERIVAEGADAFLVRDFLSPGQCDALIALIDERNRPSTLMSPTTTADFRNSASSDMNRWSPEVQPIDRSIAALLGVESKFGETIQGQRYAVGQQFRAHHDYFSEHMPYWKDMVKVGGQRTWTAMIYLNHVEEGGATWFPRAGVRVRPERGLLLAWDNMGRDGMVNVQTLHEGTPVTRGVKYIVTKWFRERPWLGLEA